MPHELLLRPVHLVSHLWQERAAAIALTDIDAVTVQLKLVKALDASHGCKHRDLNVDIVQFLTADGHEPRILKGCGTGHLRHNLIQRGVFTEMSDAATKMTVLVQRHESPTFFREVRGER